MKVPTNEKNTFFFKKTSNKLQGDLEENKDCGHMLIPNQQQMDGSIMVGMSTPWLQREPVMKHLAIPDLNKLKEVR